MILLRALFLNVVLSHLTIFAATTEDKTVSFPLIDLRMKDASFGGSLVGIDSTATTLVLFCTLDATAPSWATVANCRSRPWTIMFGPSTMEITSTEPGFALSGSSIAPSVYYTASCVLSGNLPGSADNLGRLLGDAQTVSGQCTATRSEGRNEASATSTMVPQYAYEFGHGGLKYQPAVLTAGLEKWPKFAPAATTFSRLHLGQRSTTELASGKASTPASANHPAATVNSTSSAQSSDSHRHSDSNSSDDNGWALPLKFGIMGLAIAISFFFGLVIALMAHHRRNEGSWPFPLDKIFVRPHRQSSHELPSENQTPVAELGSIDSSGIVDDYGSPPRIELEGDSALPRGELKGETRLNLAELTGSQNSTDHEGTPASSP
jgi:hypothetical protein